MNVTLSPEQMLVVDADTTTEGTAIGVTVIVIAVDVTVATVAQLALDVNLHAIVSPFANTPVVKFEEIAPTTSTPFLTH